MKINVLNNETSLHLFDYRSAVIPRINEVIEKDEDRGMLVRSVVHKVTQDGEPYANIYVERF